MYEGTIGSFKRMDKRLIPESSVRKGFRASRIDHPSKGGWWHDTKPSVRNNLRNRGYRRVRFRSCGTVGYGPTMWVKIRKGGDVLRDHASKACQRVACRLCRQQRRYQGRRTKRTIFLLVETRQTNRQGSRPSMITGMSSTIVTGSYWQSGTTRCLHK